MVFRSRSEGNLPTGSAGDGPTLESERVLQEQVRQTAHAAMTAIQRRADIDAPLRVAAGEIVGTVTEAAREESANPIVIGRGSLQSRLGGRRTHTYGIIERSSCPVLSVKATG